MITYGIRKLMRREVVLHMIEESIKGILVETYRDVLVLEHARLLTERGDVEMAGRQYVPREKVRYIQEPRVG